MVEEKRESGGWRSEPTGTRRISNEERLRKAQELARVGDWSYDTALQHLSWSDELYRIFALDPGEPISIGRFLDRVHPDDRGALEAQVASGLPYRSDYRIVLPDGSVRHIHEEVEIQRDQEGRTVGCWGTAQDVSERKRGEAALRESEERYRSLFNQSGDTVLLLEQERGGYPVIVDANEAAVRLHGYSREELLGKPISFIDPDVTPAVEAQREELLRTQGFATFPVTHRKKDGTVLHAEARVQVVTIGGRPLLLSVERDVTERMRAAERLRRSEEQLKEAQQLARIGNWEWDLGSRTLSWSEEVYRIFGQQPGSFAPSADVFESAIHPEDRASFLRQREELLAAEKAACIDHRIVLPDGSVRWVQERAQVIDDARGATQRVIGTVQDITDRKQAEGRLRQSEQFIRNILDTVDEGFIVIDREYRIVTANRAYCAQAALPFDEIVGRRCYEISHQLRRPCHEGGEECPAQQVFTSGSAAVVRHQHRDAQGGLIFVESKAFPVKDDSGAVTSVIETINNVTERHLLEEERLKTQKLESIGMLAGGIAHDFNNLLQGVFGYISMAKIRLDQREKALEMLEQAEKALHQSVSLTAQLLTFSKGGKPVKRPIALLPMIENAVKFALSGSRSEYRISSEPGLWPVDADEGQLAQVIQNIALNADQAMPLGGNVRIDLSNLPASAQRPSGATSRDQVRISISDSGVGIPEKLVGKIFDPYFTTKEKGSGLGLATSYSIVRSHAGTIEVSSEEGRGSTFLISLPAAAAGAATLRQEAAVPEGRIGRILLMDDEELIREVAGELLAALGHTVVCVDRGEAALEAYRAALAAGNPFDLVILDLTIRGGMGGEETVGKLLETDPGVKAVASSGYSDDGALADYRQKGFKAFLKKPYSIPELSEILNKLLQGGTAGERSG